MVSTEEEVQHSEITATEAEAYVDALVPLGLDEYASPKWHMQHEYMEKLNLQSHFNILHRGDEFVKEALVDMDKVPIVIHELVAAEVWKFKVWPMIEGHISEHARIRAYNCLYHEATLVALLEALFFHQDACEAAGERLMELVDYCDRKINWLISRPPPSTKARTTADIIREAEDEAESLKIQLDEINFNCAMVALTILRYMTDHLQSLHVSVAQRLVRHHDFVASLAVVLELAPWNKREAIVLEVQQDDGSMKKKKQTRHKQFNDNKWGNVEPGSRELCKTEAQIWLSLYNLIMSAGQAATGMGYPMDNSRKQGVLKLKKYFNDVLCDQLPPLTDLRRVVEEIGMMDLGTDEGSSFIIEQVSEMREAMLADQDWDVLSRQTLQSYFQMTANERQAEVMKMNDMYSMFDLGDLDDGGKINDAALLDKYGSVGLAKLFLVGDEKEGVEKDLVKACYYFRLGADNGDAEAQYCYGQRLKKGQGVDQDAAEAVTYFNAAAAQGHTNAMNWLGHIYEKGDGIPASAEQALSFNRMAAEAGDNWALTKMGMRFLKGDAVDADEAEARRWLQQAAERGSKAAVEKLHELDSDDLD
jgi:hypothetical protein